METITLRLNAMKYQRTVGVKPAETLLQRKPNERRLIWTRFFYVEIAVSDHNNRIECEPFPI